MSLPIIICHGVCFQSGDGDKNDDKSAPLWRNWHTGTRSKASSSCKIKLESSRSTLIQRDHPSAPFLRRPLWVREHPFLYGLYTYPARTVDDGQWHVRQADVIAPATPRLTETWHRKNTCPLQCQAAKPGTSYLSSLEMCKYIPFRV